MAALERICFVVINDSRIVAACIAESDSALRHFFAKVVKDALRRLGRTRVESSGFCQKILPVCFDRAIACLARRHDWNEFPVCRLIVDESDGETVIIQALSPSGNWEEHRVGASKVVYVEIGPWFWKKTREIANQSRD